MDSALDAGQGDGPAWEGAGNPQSSKRVDIEHNNQCPTSPRLRLRSYDRSHTQIHRPKLEDEKDTIPGEKAGHRPAKSADIKYEKDAGCKICHEQGPLSTGVCCGFGTDNTRTEVRGDIDIEISKEECHRMAVVEGFSAASLLVGPTAVAKSNTGYATKSCAIPTNDLKHSIEGCVGGVEIQQRPLSTNQSLPHNRSNTFQELLQEVMRQSDAERARDKLACAWSFLGSEPLTQQTLPNELSKTPISLKPATIDSFPNDIEQNEDYGYDVSHEQSAINGPEGGSAAMDIDVPSILATKVAPEPQATLPDKQWVQYLSQEGYPYIFNAATGESKWVVVRERETPLKICGFQWDCELKSKGVNENYKGGETSTGMKSGAMVAGRGKGAAGGELDMCEIWQSSQHPSDQDTFNR